MVSVARNSEFEVELGNGDLSLFNLFSTSPTFSGDVLPVPKQSSFCKYNAPVFAYQRASHTYGVVQGCCNHWDCPRCGIMVAKAHYGRIVQGCREIAESEQLYFLTITCRGKDCTEQEAVSNYLVWTSKFLDAAYSKAKRDGQTWKYVQVTEKQGRGHPHSHIITTFNPGDLEDVELYGYFKDNSGILIRQKRNRLRSKWVEKQVVKSGLGEQYDISRVQTVEGASRYVAKYMFKKTQFSDKFPHKWKRVRYSQSFPKLPKQKSNAFVLLTGEDWKDLSDRADVLDCYGYGAYHSATYELRNTSIIIEYHPEG